MNGSEFKVENITIKEYVFAKAASFIALAKLRLSFLVVFSGAFGYILGNQGQFDWIKFSLFSLAGLLITASSNSINQLKEIHLDKLMTRTQNRPLPTGALTYREGLIFAIITLALSLILFLGYVNLNTTILALISLVLYAFVYTPLKTKHSVAVFVGAIPGALPPMIGWLAARNDFGWEPGILFAIQFIWQFPHFWAIAWVLDEDYKKAGIRLLPGTGQDINTAFQIMVYTLMLLPLGLMPYLLGMTGITSAVVAVISGASFLILTFMLMRQQSKKAALKIMFGSFIYLPIVQISFLIDKL